MYLRKNRKGVLVGVDPSSSFNQGSVPHVSVDLDILKTLTRFVERLNVKHLP